MRDRPGTLGDSRCGTVAEIPEVLAFVLAARAELFPKLSASGMPADLARCHRLLAL
ncbi:hypothetical protein PS664_03425 [Pseudomonas fluorescens]|nr:hypothetical protein PS664_03425 [Pseudomonas fluorescens]